MVNNFLYVCWGGLFLAWAFTGGLTSLIWRSMSIWKVAEDPETEAIRHVSRSFWWTCLAVGAIIGGGLWIAAELMKKEIRRYMEAIRLDEETERGRQASVSLKLRQQPLLTL